MLKAGVGLVVVGVVAMMGAVSVQHGCQDARQAVTQWVYAPKRDMRSTVVIVPNKTMLLPPDSIAVPVQGREHVFDRDVLSATLRNPVAATDSSIARGERKFVHTCVPCHGAKLEGNGPVAARFIPPPDLLKETTRNRTDGFIYSYIRHGGAIMPSYGAQVSAAEAWDLINFIRYQQRTNPR